MKDFDAVVFDMDGVIFDSERAIMECWIELAEKYSIPDIKTPYYKCIGVNAARTRQIIFDTYGEDFPFDKYDRETSQMYHDRYDGGRLPVKKGAREMLEFLKKRNKKIALASSSKKETVIRQLNDAGMLDYFDEIVTGDMVEKSKPEPDIFLKACEKLGVLPQRAYAIEDSFNGIRAAYSGKLKPIMVPDILPADDEMRQKAEAVLESLVDAADYLDKGSF